MKTNERRYYVTWDWTEPCRIVKASKNHAGCEDLLTLKEAKKEFTEEMNGRLDELDDDIKFERKLYLKEIAYLKKEKAKIKKRMKKYQAMK